MYTALFVTFSVSLLLTQSERCCFYICHLSVVVFLKSTVYQEAFFYIFTLVCVAEVGHTRSTHITQMCLPFAASVTAVQSVSSLPFPAVLFLKT